MSRMISFIGLTAAAAAIFYAASDQGGVVAEAAVTAIDWIGGAASALGRGLSVAGSAVLSDWTGTVVPASGSVALAAALALVSLVGFAAYLGMALGPRRTESPDAIAGPAPTQAQLPPRARPLMAPVDVAAPLEDGAETDEKERDKGGVIALPAPNGGAKPEIRELESKKADRAREPEKAAEPAPERAIALSDRTATKAMPELKETPAQEPAPSASVEHVPAPAASAANSSAPAPAPAPVKTVSPETIWPAPVVPGPSTPPARVMAERTVSTDAVVASAVLAPSAFTPKPSESRGPAPEADGPEVEEAVAEKIASATDVTAVETVRTGDAKPVWPKLDIPAPRFAPRAPAPKSAGLEPGQTPAKLPAGARPDSPVWPKPDAPAPKSPERQNVEALVGAEPESRKPITPPAENKLVSPRPSEAARPPAPSSPDRELAEADGEVAALAAPVAASGEADAKIEDAPTQRTRSERAPKAATLSAAEPALIPEATARAKAQSALSEEADPRAMKTPLAAAPAAKTAAAGAAVDEKPKAARISGEKPVPAPASEPATGLKPSPRPARPHPASPHPARPHPAGSAPMRRRSAKTGATKTGATKAGGAKGGSNRAGRSVRPDAAGPSSKQPQRAQAPRQPHKGGAGAPPIPPAAARRPSDGGGLISAVGLIAGLLFFGALALWGLFAPLESAVIAPGVVRVDTNRFEIDHPDGGVIAKLLVAEGDRVAAGQALIELDRTELEAELRIAESRHDEMRAQLARHEAAMERREAIVFPEDLHTRASTNVGLAESMRRQIAVFGSTEAAIRAEIDVRRESIQRLNERIAGLELQIRSLETQREIAVGEEAVQARLFEDGLATQSRLLGLRREVAGFDGSIGGAQASIAEARASISEIELEVTQLQSERVAEATEQAREIAAALQELEPRIDAISSRLGRTIITAPADGVVFGLTEFAEGGAVRAGDVVLEIVPTGARLVVEAQVRPVDRDSISAGMGAEVRLTAFNARTTAPFEGKLEQISADARFDQVAQTSHYAAVVAFAPEALDGFLVSPGMPADVVLPVKARTPLEYLMEPLTANWRAALREE